MVPLRFSSNSLRQNQPTPELLQAERFAEVGEQLAVPKTRAIVATKKVAPAIGLKGIVKLFVKFCYRRNLA